MRVITFWAALLLAFICQAGELKLSMAGKALDGKHLYVAVYSLPEDFLVREDKAIQRAVAATGERTELLIPNLPAGEYAVAVFADINGNGKLDTNFIGIPKEPVGFSRDAKGRFGPPKFADAAFKVGDGATSQSFKIE